MNKTEANRPKTGKQLRPGRLSSLARAIWVVDPLLGLVVGVLIFGAALAGYRLGFSAGRVDSRARLAKSKARENREPRVRASWLKPNVFFRPKAAEQLELQEPKIRILS